MVTVEEAIRQEIRDWSAHVLEEPSDYFSGLPPCPYAQRAWSEKRVLISFKRDSHEQDIVNAILKFSDDYDLHIIVDLAFEEDPEGFEQYLYELNEFISEGVFGDKDLWLMGFHPNDVHNDVIEDQSFTPLVETQYALIFVQRLTKLQEAADKLKAKGYYEQYLQEYDAGHLFEKRQNLYNRLMESKKMAMKPKKMMRGGPVKMMRGGPVKEMAEGGMVSPRKKEAMGGKTKCRVRGVK